MTENAARLIEDQRAVTACSTRRREVRALTVSDIRALHDLLMRHQTHVDAVDHHGNQLQIEVVRGAWKRLPNHTARSDGSMHGFCPPEQVPDEMDRLLGDAPATPRPGRAPRDRAAWLHHRLTQIHPFQDGTGRVARASPRWCSRRPGTCRW